MTRKTKEEQRSALLGQLKKDIALNREFVDDKEAVFLSIAWTWTLVEKTGRTFFAAYGITDSQFNALMILWDYRASTLKQHELADLLVVNRASAGSLIDRLEKNKWIRREDDAADRRAYVVRLTDAGIAKMREVKTAYYKLLGGVTKGMDDDTLLAVLRFNNEFRRGLVDVVAAAEQKKSKK
ncbi:MAG: MarR family transcriptional regulator [Betaproteobacteria bacterium]